MNKPRRYRLLQQKGDKRTLWKVSVTLPLGLVAEVDALALKEQRNRSNLFSVLLGEALAARKAK